jgi:hypothetical protein
MTDTEAMQRVLFLSDGGPELAVMAASLLEAREALAVRGEAWSIR